MVRKVPVSLSPLEEELLLLLMLAFLLAVKWYHMIILMYFFLIFNDVQHFLLAVSILSLVKYLFFALDFFLMAVPRLECSSNL